MNFSIDKETKNLFRSKLTICNRAVARSENPGGGARSNMVGIIYPLVEIGLIDLPKSGGATPRDDTPVYTWTTRIKPLSR